MKKASNIANFQNFGNLRIKKNFQLNVNSRSHIFLIFYKLLGVLPSRHRTPSVRLSSLRLFLLKDFQLPLDFYLLFHIYSLALPNLPEFKNLCKYRKDLDKDRFYTFND